MKNGILEPLFRGTAPTATASAAGIVPRRIIAQERDAFQGHGLNETPGVIATACDRSRLQNWASSNSIADTFLVTKYVGNSKPLFPIPRSGAAIS
jgi:hypothetical protein